MKVQTHTQTSVPERDSREPRRNGGVGEEEKEEGEEEGK